MVKLYGKSNGCSNCEMAKSMLERNNIEYEFIDVSKDKEALNLIKSLGYRQVPVIEDDGDFYILKTLEDLLFKLGY